MVELRPTSLSEPKRAVRPLYVTENVGAEPPLTTNGTPMRNAIIKAACSDPIGAIVRTSGSTGVPDLVALSRSAMTRSAEATHAALGGQGQWVAALPFQHIAGLMTLVRAAVAQLPPVIAYRAGPFDVEEFSCATREAQKAEAPLYTALVTRQLATLMATVEGVNALRKYRGVLLGGGMIPERLLKDATRAGIRVVTTYGMTETSGGCVYNGTPLDGTKVKIGKNDVILLSGPTLMCGYLGKQTDWHVDETGRKWFQTSDRGRFDEGGRLHITGRTDDIINSGGKKVDTSQVREALLQCEGVQDAFVLGLPDNQWGQVVSALIVPSMRPLPIKQIRSHMRDTLGKHCVPRIIAEVDALPTSSLGKVSRTEAERLLHHAIGQGHAWKR